LESDSGEETSTSDLESTSNPERFVRSKYDDLENPSEFQPMALFDPDDLLGRTYLSHPEDNGERFRAQVIQKVIDNTETNVQDRVKFLVRVDDKQADEIITYTQLCDYLEE
jgi:hypothetical protein